MGGTCGHAFHQPTNLHAIGRFQFINSFIVPLFDILILIKIHQVTTLRLDYVFTVILQYFAVLKRKFLLQTLPRNYYQCFMSSSI